MGIKPTSKTSDVRRSARAPKKRERSPFDTRGVSSGDEAADHYTRKRRRKASPDASWSPSGASSPATSTGTLPPAPSVPQHVESRPEPTAVRYAPIWPALHINGQIVRVQCATGLSEAPPPCIAWHDPITPPALPAPVSPGPSWWKTGAAAPGPLDDIYLASDALHRHVPGVLPLTPNFNQLRAFAHRADVKETYTWLARADYALIRFEEKHFGMAFEAIEDPTFEQVEKMEDVQLSVRLSRLHAMVHTVVGSGVILEKLRTLHMLGMGQPSLFADVRMGEYNLLHLASMAPMLSGDRGALVAFLKDMGVDPAARDASGMTPLHHLAQAPWTTPDTLDALAGWRGSSDVNINARNDANETAFYLACLAQPHNFLLTQWFLDRGAAIPSPWRAPHHLDVLTPVRPYLPHGSGIPEAGSLVVPQ